METIGPRHSAVLGLFTRRAGSALLTTRLNRWDWALLPLVLLVLTALAYAAMQMNRPHQMRTLWGGLRL